MSNSSENLHEKHQAVLYEILQEFDEVCRKHNISYMLFAGSALGAVRHGGFIPWDDDLDVVMFRPEYERFLAVAAQELDREKYYVQKEFLDHWPMFFSKLRKNNTACLERYIPRDPQMHQGVYLDIFPCDNLADGKFMRKLQFYCSKAVIAKSLDRRGYLTDSLKKSFLWHSAACFPGSSFGASLSAGMTMIQRVCIRFSVVPPSTTGMFTPENGSPKLSGSPSGMGSSRFPLIMTKCLPLSTATT